MGSLKPRFRLGDCTNRYGLTQCAGACTCSRTHARANLMVVVGLLVLTFLLPPQISCLLWFVCFISPTLLFLLGVGCVFLFFFSFFVRIPLPLFCVGGIGFTLCFVFTFLFWGGDVLALVVSFLFRVFVAKIGVHSFNSDGGSSRQEGCTVLTPMRFAPNIRVHSFNSEKGSSRKGRCTISIPMGGSLRK